MGEIDTKPFESVQAALSLFGEKNDQRKNRSNSCKGKERGLDDLLLKDLATYKMQLEVKESSHKQVLFKLEKYQKTVAELSSKLKNSEAERDKYIEKCGEPRNRTVELEFKDLSDMYLESGKVQEQLLDAVKELKAAQEELHTTKAELTATKESKAVAEKHAELMEIAVNMEKEKIEELLKHISELNEANHLMKLAAIVADKENSMLLLEKEDAIKMATEASVQADEHLEEMRKQMEMMQELENQLSAKTIFIDSIQSELKKLKESHNPSLQATSDAINNINQLKSEPELSERLGTDQAIYVRSLETEVVQLKLRLTNADEEVSHLICRVNMLTGEIQKLKCERDGRQSEEQIEIALLKSELHRQRSKMAAAEAAEARTKSIKSELYLAVRQLTVKSDDAKKKAQRLKQEAEETKNLKTTHFTDFNHELEQSELDESETESKEGKYQTDAQITISLQEYESLIQKAEKADQIALSPPDVST